MKTRTILLIVVMCFALGSTIGWAAETKPGFQITKQETIRSLLQKNLGKQIVLQMDSGTQVFGTIKMVGKSLVHVTKPKGKEYFDIIILIDKIEALEIMVKSD